MRMWSDTVGVDYQRQAKEVPHMMRVRDKRGRWTSRQRHLPHYEDTCAECREDAVNERVNGLGRVVPEHEKSHWWEALSR